MTLFPNVISDGETERTIADTVDEDDVKMDRVCAAYVGKNGRETLHLLVSGFFFFFSKLVADTLRSPY